MLTSKKDRLAPELADESMSLDADVDAAATAVAVDDGTGCCLSLDAAATVSAP